MPKRKVKDEAAGAVEQPAGRVTRPPDPSAPLNVRVPLWILAKMDEAAAGLGIDRSSLLKMILAEQMEAYLQRGRAARGGQS
jgi:hypothetical protein